MTAYLEEKRCRSATECVRVGAFQQPWQMCRISSRTLARVVTISGTEPPVALCYQSGHFHLPDNLHPPPPATRHRRKTRVSPWPRRDRSVVEPSGTLTRPDYPPLGQHQGGRSEGVHRTEKPGSKTRVKASRHSTE